MIEVELQEPAFQFATLTQIDDVVDQFIDVLLRHEPKRRHRRADRAVLDNAHEVLAGRLGIPLGGFPLEGPTPIVTRPGEQERRRRTIPSTRHAVAMDAVSLVKTAAGVDVVGFGIRREILAGHLRIRRLAKDRIE
ncbi:MAG: hypothetical protein U1D30_22920 [Planctomycetota bacterium]